MSDTPVLLTVEDAVATITLNRPDAGNTIDLAMAQALVQAAIRCDQDAAIRCVILTGRGRLFCGGGDIGAFAQVGEGVPAFLSELAGSLHMAISRLLRMRKPLLVLVNGPAAGAGLSLAISGDAVLAAQSAHFTAAYGGVGLTPDGGMSWLLPKLIGLRKAQEMILTNRRVSAAEAETIGLVTRAVNEHSLAEEGARLAASLSASATGALGAARMLLLESYDSGFETQLEREARCIAAAGATAECREGVQAFLSRRKPDFRGVI